MKYFKALFVLFLSYAGIEGSAYADYQGPGKIEEFAREIHTGTDVNRGEKPGEVGAGPTPVILATDISVPNCGGSSWIFNTENQAGKDLYAAALAAFMTGKKVYLLPNSCTHYQGRWYTALGGIRIVP